MKTELKEGYIIQDLRGQQKPGEVCRVCGSPDVHTAEYNAPTMKCIDFLRGEIATLRDQLDRMFRHV